MISDYTVPVRLLIGKGSIYEIPDIAKSKGEKVFLVMDKDFDKIVSPVCEVTNECKRLLPEAFVYYKEVGEPEIKMVDEGGLIARKIKPDVVVSIGGGSVIDFAKAMSVLSRHEGTTWVDFQLAGKKIENALPFHIAVPTTAGTGSEATRVSVVGNKNEGIKKSVAHPAMVPNLAVLDPLMTERLPKEIAVLTAVDALSHALESFVSTNARMYTEELSLASMRLISKNLIPALNGEENAREGMLLASYFAGISLSSGVGAAHIIAQPLSAVTGISHSAAITCLLPEVININVEHSREKYALFSGIFGMKKDAFIAKNVLLELYEKIGVKYHLTDYCKIEADTFEKILNSVKKSTNHIKTNPRPVDDGLLLEILRKI